MKRIRIMTTTSPTKGTIKEGWSDSRLHALSGYDYVWDWNLGSDMHLFAETLLPATAGKVAITRPK